MSEEEELILNLKTQIASLHDTVKELEAENAKLCSLVSNCRCKKVEDKLGGSVLQCKSPEEKIGQKKKSQGIGQSVFSHTVRCGLANFINTSLIDYDTSAMNHHSKRYVALKVMYFGQRFYGFASEAQMDPTVESEIFKALEKTRLLVGNKKEIQYSRCGRTDKGVSAVGQVIALFLRSKLKDIDARCNDSREICPEEERKVEIDYVKVLNHTLPRDIRVVGWCPIPNDFSARFSCLSREYKYFFWRDNMNLSAMETAGKKFLGEHDFRNFCKMDAANVHNYRRNVTSFEICPSDMRFEGYELYAIKIKGSAFLWHQVRCMVAVLFMIGQGLESPDLIDVLLDTERTPRKPQFLMASEIPLVLHSCEFEGLNFMCSSDAGQALRTHLDNECRLFQLQAAIFHEGLLNCLTLSHDDNTINKGRVKKKSLHVPLKLRPTEPSYEERHAKLANMKAIGSATPQHS